RRGIDDLGNVVVLHHPKEDVRQAVVLARAPAEPLESNFRPSYGMVLNLLQRRNVEEARQLVEMSFGQFLARREAVRHDHEARQLEEQHQQLSRPLCPGELGDQRLYRKTRERYRAAIKQARSLTGSEPEVVQERERLAERRKRLKDAFESSPCHHCPVFDPCREQERERNRVERDLRLLKRVEEKIGTPYWSEFERLADVLRETQYLQDDQPTEAGEMAACLRATNVLFLAEVIGSGVLEELRAAEAAAAVTALVTEDGRRLHQIERPPVSRYVSEVLHRLELIADRVMDLQERHHVEVPIDLNGILCGVTESWARGTEWEELERQVSLEAGDIIRLLRRTLDVCRQFAYSRGVPQRLSELCRQAERRIARDEVRESLTMVGLVNPGEELPIEESL
ncbi:MAG: hypothetical protein KC910_32905, partial [Candidatus Eremiobacteraeota bacterium]|nr:hypothetical protein [Candidatus Eremiobacteraeota bacterium]